MNKLLLPVILCLGINVSGQQEGDPYQNNPSDKIFLPTPEQASLLKFTDIPPGNHTGVHGFSVPIYTIQGKDFSLPISIDYHGMGIKVDELSGSVGIGWALNIGGISLSEEVRGEKDLAGVHRLNHFNPDEFDPFFDPTDYGDYYDAKDMAGINTTTWNVPSSELQPDYFSYSLLNNRGKFMIDNENIPHTIPKDNVKILNTQQFIDSKGFKYYFSQQLQDQSISGYGSDGVMSRESYSYKIDYIELPYSTEKIIFDYYKVSYRYASANNKNMKYRIMNGEISNQGSLSSPNTFATVTEYLPKTIEYNNIKVEFKYKMTAGKLTGRSDVDAAYDPNNFLDGKKGGILEYIEVSDKTTPGLVKKFKVITDYFTSANGEVLPTNMCGGSMGFDCNTLYKRLMTKGVEDVLAGTDYGFEYVGETTNEFLPARFSYKKDYWGMYNGEPNTLGLPEAVFLLNGEINYFEGDNKNPNEHYAQIGTLKTVKLPTGGYQEFEYELDEFQNTFVHNDETTTLPIHDYQPREFELDMSQEILNQPIPISVPAPDYREGLAYKVKFYYPCNPNNDLLVGDTPQNGVEYYRLEFHGGTSPRWIFSDGDHEIEQLNSNNNYYFKLVNHGTPFCNGSTGPYDVPPAWVNVKLTWLHDNVTSPLNRKAGTLRVKSITLKDKNGQAQIKRTYNYNNFDGNPDLSSGKFYGRSLNTTYQSNELIQVQENQNEENFEYFNISSNGLYNLNTSFGKSVVYERVTETYESTDSLQSGSNHKKEYLFKLPDEPIYRHPGKLPIVPAPHLDYTGGFLLKERIKDNQNKTLRLTTNEYYPNDYFFNGFSANYYSQPNTTSSALSPMLLVATPGKFSGNYIFNVNYSYVYSAWIKLKETMVDEYENNTLVRSNYTKYYYNENTGQENQFKSILPVSTITGTSLNKGTTYKEEIKTVYKYPQDLIGIEQNASMQSLKDANIITEPVFTETFLLKTGAQEKKLSETHTKYNGLLPSEVHFRNGTGNININTVEDRKVRYSQYDANGNILEYIMEDGTPVAVVWGYNGQYPILKVEGVTYNSLNTAITNLDLHNKSNQDNDRCMGTNTECKEATLRGLLMQMVIDICAAGNFAQCPETMVTAYTYDPLVGITSVIQPNGQVQYYDYDTAGRLNEVYTIEMMNNVPVKTVLKKTKYNYQP